MFFVPFHFVIFNLPFHTMIFCTFEVSTIILPQRTHWYKFSLARLFMCLFVWFLEISPLPHIVQWYGFFPVFLLLCIFEWFLDMNFLPHSAQGFRFSLAWLFIWLFMWLLEMDPLPHRAQWYGFFLVWIFMWQICVVCGVVCGCTYPISFLWLGIIRLFSTFSMLHCLLPSSHFSLSFRFFFKSRLRWPHSRDQHGPVLSIWSPLYDSASSAYVVSTPFQESLCSCTDHN